VSSTAPDGSHAGSGSGSASGSGSTSGSGSQSRPSSPGAGSSSGPEAHAADGSGSGPSGSDRLQKFLDTAALAAGAGYEATYKANGSPTTFTFAQLGAMTSFASGGTTDYSDGAQSTVCDAAGGTVSCDTGAKPLTGVLALVSPSELAGAVRAASAHDVPVKQSSEHHDGQLSTCVSYVTQGQRVKYCVNGAGIVTYMRIPSATFQITGYTTAVTAADVTVPPGATMLPSPATAS
jgi:hypothetical protein